MSDALVSLTLPRHQVIELLIALDDLRDVLWNALYDASIASQGHPPEPQPKASVLDSRPSFPIK